MNVDGIIDQISSKTGISKEQARTAFTTTVDFLKDKLPAGIGSQLSAFTGGEKDSGAPDGLKAMKDKFF